MNRLKIEHTTVYNYTQPVEFGIHRLVLRPREGHDLQVEELDLAIEPVADVTWHRDLFGNSIAFARFRESAGILKIHNTVIINRRDHISTEDLLQTVSTRLPIAYSTIEDPVARGYLTPVYPEETRELSRWANEQFSPSPGAGVVSLLAAVNDWIFQNIHYRRREDRGVQSPLQTLKSASGSCRDMATLFLEIVRVFDIASRFASGYLDSAASAAGRASTHAWVEAYYPDHGWYGYDPTLGERTSLKHIVTGVSSHPRGVMPVSGSYQGPPGSYSGMTVSVQIQKLPSSPSAKNVTQ